MRAPATTPSRSVGDACIVVEDEPNAAPAAHPVPPWKTQRAKAWRARLPLFPPSVAPSTAPGTLQSEQAGYASSGGPPTAAIEQEVPEPAPRKPNKPGSSHPLVWERLCAAPKKRRWLTVEDLFVDVMEEVEKRRRLEASIERLEASFGLTSTATRMGASTSTSAGNRGARSSSDLAPAGAPPWRT